MSLLGGVNYGSDGSDDEESRGAPAPAPAPAPRRSTAPPYAAPAAALKKTGKKKKKKAKVALSILPPEIQAALLRAPPPGQQGAGGDDDEDAEEDDAEQELDEEERARRRKIRAQVAETKAIEGRKAAGAKGLFALLPKPKAEEALENALKITKDEPTSARAPAPAAAAAAPAKVAVQEKKEAEKEEAESEASEDEEEDEEEDGGGLLHPSLLAGARAAVLPRVSMLNIAPRVSTTAASVAAAAPAPAPGAAAEGAPGPSTSTAGGGGGEAVAPAAAAESYEAQWAAYYAAQGQQGGGGGEQEIDPETARQWQEYYRAQAQAQAQAASHAAVEGMDMGAGGDAELDEFGRPKQASRKDKMRARQALQQGDIGALDQLAKGTQVASVAAPQEKWDPFRHGPPKKQEKVRIAAAFYDTASGETVTLQDATRTHKRKHHINSLAIQAAELESELLEGRSRGMLTKAQTQGKYGW